MVLHGKTIMFVNFLLPFNFMNCYDGLILAGGAPFDSFDPLMVVRGTTRIGLPIFWNKGMGYFCCAFLVCHSE